MADSFTGSTKKLFILGGERLLPLRPQAPPPARSPFPAVLSRVSCIGVRPAHANSVLVGRLVG